MPTSRRDPAVGGTGVGPTLKVAVVARRLGVAPATLRTWARRYGLGPSTHVAGAHRQYSADDLERLSVMRRLTLEGVAPAEAAKIAVAAQARSGASVTDFRGDSGPDDALVAGGWDAGGQDDGDWLGAGSSATAADSASSPVTFGRSGGGRVVALPSSAPAVRGLARAALSLDSTACRRILTRAIERDGVIAAWDDLARPVLVGLGQRWETSGAGIDVEHLFAESLLSGLRAASGPERRRSTASVLLACSENEQHSLPLHVLAAALDERGATVRVLGARVPRQALAEAVRRSGPAAVLVYATMPVEDSGTLSDLPRMRPAPRIFVGGPGWAGVALPAGARQVRSLTEAVDELARTVGA